ncbi:MAG: hypothetical protein ACXACK_15940 [Candidatus Hodarchaeales archaeon]|jgi:ABC-type Na+ efflux pump permease subunit
MVNIVTEICKKELKIRFGSKKAFLPIIFSLGLPILVFIPRLQDTISHVEPGSEYLSLMFFLIIPVMITTLVGINTFVNEIRWKTIKSLLVAPVSEEEILFGKSLACIIPGLLVVGSLSSFFIITLENLKMSLLILFFVLGPLSVIFTTLIFIIGTSRFPSIAEGGGAILMPIGGLLIIFLIFIFIKELLNIPLMITYLILALIIAILTCGTFFLAKKCFNRDILVLSV